MEFFPKTLERLEPTHNMQKCDRCSYVRTQEQGDAPLVRPDPRRERVGVVEPVGRGGQVGLRAHRAGMDGCGFLSHFLCTSKTTTVHESTRKI